MYAVIRVRGHGKIKRNALETLYQLHLTRVNHMVLLPEDDTTRHMLQAVKDYVTWGEVEMETLEALSMPQGAPEGVSRKVIRLHPPRRGWEAIKEPYRSGGSLGYRGKEINKLIQKMVPVGEGYGEQNK